MKTVEVEHSSRKKKKKVVSKRSVVDKDTMMDMRAEVEKDKKKDYTMSDNEEREEESKDDIADADEKMKRKEKTFDGEERKVKKKKKTKNREKDNVLVGYENGRDVKKRKKEKRDHKMLHYVKETKLEKKKKKDNDSVVIAGIEEREVESNVKAHDKANKKNPKRKEKETKDAGKVSVDSHSGNKDGLVQGKRFSKEEDELIKKAVSDYIEAKQLGDDGLYMVLHCKSCREVRGCWKEIGVALPWRPPSSIYRRAHMLYERGEGKWTLEEVEYIRKSYKKYGPNWRKMADKLGRCQIHVRNAFQFYQFRGLNKGKWSQDEYQTLFELVNKDLQKKAFEEKKLKHGLLRDNISWEAIGRDLGTRSHTFCCKKWYHQLTSPMVAEGKWADVDDYRLLIVLFELDASCEDEVDWDNLFEHRSGDLCRKRWLQMVRHLGEHGSKSFSEQVEALSKRYCPDLAEIREVMDARRVVD